LKILLIGLGSAGKRHWQILKNLNEYGWDDIELHHFINWEIADNFSADVAFICPPTNLHVETAIKCAERGLHLFIEKPLDCKLDYGLAHLKNIVNTKELSTYIAYPLRHLRTVEKLRYENIGNVAWFVCHSNLTNWKTNMGYSADWKTGGGALLELSHELDLAEYLMGDITEIDGTLAWKKNKYTNAETAAFLRVSHEGGKISWHSLDILSEKEQRFIKFKDQQINIIPDEQMFLDQVIYFLDNLNGTRMMNNIFNASRLYEKIIAFREGEYAKHYK